MNYAELKTTVMSEINDVLTSVDEKSLDIMCDIIQSSNKIVVAGAGRMGYSIKCFGMR